MKEQDLGHGQHIMGFDTLDEMLAFIAKAEDAVQAQPITPQQQSIDWGAYVFRAVADGPDHALAIWGHVWSLTEWREKEIAAGATQEELEYSTERLVDAHERGYRYGEYYSEPYPKGDIGSAHISTLWPISRRDFEYARRIGWRMGNEIWERLRAEVGAAARKERKG
jgi:hypothetical protein